MRMPKIFLPGEAKEVRECNGNIALTTALHFAKNGHYVFPIAKGTKVPALKKSWKELSTTDEETIKGWAKSIPGCNFALDCGKSGLFVVDVDVHDDKPGFVSLNSLEARFGNLPKTYKVMTPSGGLHFYYAESLPTTASTVLGVGIDTRGINGYVLLPGSQLDSNGTKYRALNPRRITSITPKLRGVIKSSRSTCAYQDTVECYPYGKYKDTNDRASDVGLSTSGKSKLSDEEVLRLASNDQKFMDLLEGDWHKYDYPSQSEADMAFTAKLAFYCGHDREQMERLFSESQLLRDKWQDRKDYRDSLFEQAIALNDEIHPAQAEVEVDVALDFGEPSVPFYERAPLSGSALTKKEPPELEWIFSGAGGLPKNIVAFLSGQGGCGKSTLALQIAVSIASGKDCTYGAFQYETKGPVLAVFAEEDADEIARRVFRIKQHFGLAENDLDELLIYPRGGDPQLMSRDIKGNLAVTKGFQALRDYVKNLKPALIILDSLSVVAGEAEGTNADAAYTVARLSELCDAGEKSSVLVLSHVSKASLAAKTGRGGASAIRQGMSSSLEATSLRGASALVNNARWVMVMTQVPQKVREEMGFIAANAIAYAVPKTNYSAPLDEHFLFNEKGILTPLSQFGNVMEKTDYEALVLNVLGSRIIPKTSLIKDCTKIESMPSRAGVKDLVETLIASGKIISRKRSGRGGGSVLSRPVDTVKEVFQEVSQETFLKMLE